MTTAFLTATLSWAQVPVIVKEDNVKTDNHPSWPSTSINNELVIQVHNLEQITNYYF